MTENENEKKESVVKKLMLIGAASSVAEISTFPIDFIKTRLQIEKTRHSIQRLSTFSIIQETGGKRLYRGLSPAISRHLVYSVARCGIYEYGRTACEKYISSPTMRKVFSGAAAGIFGQFIASPTDLLKVRMISAKPGDIRYKSMTSTAVSVFRKEGIFAFYKGVLANCSRACLVNVGELAFYDISKQAVKKRLNMGENIWLHSVASIISGFFSTVLSTPADTIKSKMMSSDKLNYKGTWDCVFQTLRKEGFVGMYRGFFHCWMRLGPWQFIFMNCYEQFRKLVGMEPF